MSAYSCRLLTIEYPVSAIEPSFEFRVLYLAFKESHNGFKEPLETILSKTSAQAEQVAGTVSS